MNRILNFAAVAEILTGLALLLVPSVVGQLLLGVELEGVAVPIARIAGLALVGLGIACWPGPPIVGMFLYSTAVAIYFAWLGPSGEASGILLWPVVAAHVVMSALLLRVIMTRRREKW